MRLLKVIKNTFCCFGGGDDTLRQTRLDRDLKTKLQCAHACSVLKPIESNLLPTVTPPFTACTEMQWRKS